MNNININSRNMARLVYDTITDCLYSDSKDATNAVLVDGPIHNFGFNPERLESKRDIVQMLISELPENLKERAHFLELYKNKNGETWTEKDMDVESLVVLGIALGLLEYKYSRFVWPFGLPYLKIK